MREIVIISQRTSAIGGIQRQTFQLAKNLYERKVFQPVLICTDRNCGFAMLFTKAGFEVFDIPMGKAKTFSAAKKIMRILTDRNVAVVQTRLFRESLIGRAVRRERTDIRHVLHAGTYIDCSKNSGATKFLYHLLDKSTSKYVDLYIANGNYLKDELVNRSGIEPSKVEVILNGRDSIGVPDEPAPEPNMPLPAKIAMVANFVEGKGHDTLCKALAILNKNKIKITTRLIGSDIDDSGTRRQIETLAKKSDILQSLEFYGKTDNICQALKGISVVVLPSDSEGVPNSILEAMSIRKLVIASNTGGVGEIIDDKKTGLLCKPKDPKGLAGCLQYVFTHKAGDFEPMRSAAFERWQKEFTGEKMIDKLIEIYRKLGVL
jgi:glycosyltransferase involved in cell wall biosynthesis